MGVKAEIKYSELKEPACRVAQFCINAAKTLARQEKIINNCISQGDY